MNKITKNYVIAVLFEAAATFLFLREYLSFTDYTAFNESPVRNLYLLCLAFCLGLVVLTILRRPKILGTAGPVVVAAVSVWAFSPVFSRSFTYGIVEMKGVEMTVPGGESIDHYFGGVLVEIGLYVIVGLLIMAMILLICAVKKKPQGAALALIGIAFILLLTMHTLNTAHDRLDRTFPLIDLLKAIRENNIIHAPAQTPVYSRAALGLTFPVVALVQLLGIMFGIYDRKENIFTQAHEAFMKDLKKSYKGSLFAKESGLSYADVFEGGRTPDEAKRRAGHRGEYEAYYVLDHLLPGEKKFFFGTIIPERDDHFQETDLICLWRDIIYVVEVKNIGTLGKGLYALVNEKNWPYPYLTEGNVQFYYSPVVQNHQHLLALQSFLKASGITGYRVRSLIYYCNDVQHRIFDPECTNPEYYCLPYILCSRPYIRDRLMHDLKEKAPNRLSEDLKKAYTELSALPQAGSRERMRRLKERQYFGHMRIETKKQGYFFSQSRGAIYAYNNFYVEVLAMDILDPFDDNKNVWTYIGDSNEDLLPVDAESLEKGKLLDYYHLLQVRPFV